MELPDRPRTTVVSPLLTDPSRFTSERKLVESVPWPPRLRVWRTSPAVDCGIAIGITDEEAGVERGVGQDLRKHIGHAAELDPEGLRSATPVRFTVMVLVLKVGLPDDAARPD